jgi:thiamine pyrophosphate-dependent acetolactate synthase large subunit-like protein
MKRKDALEILAAQKGDGLSVVTMRAVPEWYQIGAAPGMNIDNIGCMGGAAATGLGLAIAQPSKQVMVIDGDGSLLMALGSLASIAGAAPANFYHFLMVNGVYETSGKQPTPGGDLVDFPALALAAGYKAAYSFDDLGVLRERLPGVLKQAGPVFIAIKVETAEERLPRPALWPKDPAGDLRKALVGSI